MTGSVALGLQSCMDCYQDLKKRPWTIKASSFSSHEAPRPYLRFFSRRKCRGDVCQTFRKALQYIVINQSMHADETTFSNLPLRAKAQGLAHSPSNLEMLEAIGKLHDSAPGASRLRASAWKASAGYDSSTDAIYGFIQIYEILNSRIQLRTRAARAVQSCTDDGVRMWMLVLCGNDEVAKSGRTGITTAYIEDMLPRERTMDCIRICLLGHKRNLL